MEVSFSSPFKKAFQKKVKGSPAETSFWQILEIFIADPFNSKLKTHKLSGKLKGLWSFSVEYDGKKYYRCFFSILFFLYSAVLFIRCSYEMPKMEDRGSIKKIISSRLNETLYIKKTCPEMVFNEQVIIIPKSPEMGFVPDSLNDYIYVGDTEFYFKVTEDTIETYFPTISKIPPNLKTKFNIKQYRLATI